MPTESDTVTTDPRLFFASLRCHWVGVVTRNWSFGSSKRTPPPLRYRVMVPPVDGLIHRVQTHQTTTKITSATANHATIGGDRVAAARLHLDGFQRLRGVFGDHRQRA